MATPSLIDADDRRTLAQGFILFALAMSAFVSLAAVVGLAWTVFRVFGGL